MQNAGNGWNSSLPFLFGLHGVGMILLFVGLVFVIVWSVRNLTPEKLKMWGIVLLVGGGFLSLLTIGAVHPILGNGSFGNRGAASCGMMRDKNTNDASGKMGMGAMMKDMMEDDYDAMDMSMNDMSSMLEGKEGDDFDKAFLEGMIPHHQGAIDMAKGADTFAKHPEIKKMSKDIMSAQQREIDQMNQWLIDWGYTK